MSLTKTIRLVHDHACQDQDMMCSYMLQHQSCLSGWVAFQAGLPECITLVFLYTGAAAAAAVGGSGDEIEQRATHHSSLTDTPGAFELAAYLQ